MKKMHLWSMLAVLMVTMLSVGLASCGDDDDNSLADPEGTVTTVMESSEGGVPIFKVFGYVDINLWISKDKFDSLNEALYIYDCGSVGGLAGITSIPTSNWVKVRSNPEAKVGHGYVLRYVNSNFSIMEYARMYITGKQNEHSYSIKYQSPFELEPASSLKSTQIVKLNACDYITDPLEYGEGKVIYEDNKYRYKIAAIAAHYFCLYPYYKEGSEWKIACSSVYDEKKVNGLWLCNLSSAISNTSIDKITQKLTDYSSTPSVMQPNLGGATGFYGYITTEDGTRKHIRFCSSNISLNHDQKSNEFGHVTSVDMYYQEY